MSTNRIIEGILDAFDWEKVKHVMDALDWKYSSVSRLKRPTFTQLRNVAKALLLAAAECKKLPYSAEQGGFLVTCFKRDEFDLYFTVTSACELDAVEGKKNKKA